MFDISIDKESLKDFELYKYIRLSNDEIRFTENHYNHSSLATDEEKPNVVSAGLIAIRGDTFIFRDYGSMTLKVQWNGEDTEILERLLGKTNSFC